MNSEVMISVLDVFCQREEKAQTVLHPHVSLSRMNSKMSEDIIQQVPSSSSFKLRSAANEVNEKLLLSVKSVSKVYDERVQELLDTTPASH